MSKREKGRDAVQIMLDHGMGIVAINGILSGMPACAFTNGAWERLLDEQIAEREKRLEVT